MTNSVFSPTSDDVVLLDEAGEPCGRHPRASVHSADTPLHLAFSIHLAAESGEVLFTRRALGKRTWPGVWTNSCCGHPLPGEEFAEAISRRVEQELGCRPSGLRVVLPEFRYRAVDASGVVENEICPVYVGTIRRDELRPDPAEVAEHEWMSFEAARQVALVAPHLLSPWCASQLRQLGADPWADAQVAPRPVAP